MVFFVGGNPSKYIEGIAGENVLMECPINTANEEMIWWKDDDRLVINGEVRFEYRDRKSFNTSTGALTILAATPSDSGEYICGAPFDDKYHLNLTVKGKR